MPSTQEDTSIWFRAMPRDAQTPEARRRKAVTLSVWNYDQMSAAERAAWHDFSTCQMIEKIKAETRAKLIKFRLLGYWGSFGGAS